MASTLWKSDSTQDYWWYQASDGEVLGAVDDYLLDIEDYTDEDTGEVDIDGIRNRLADLDYDVDYEDLQVNVAPAIARECPSGYLWVVGDYQRWDGAHAAMK